MTSAERAKALVDRLLSIEPDDDGGSVEGLRVIAEAIDAAVAEALAARDAATAEPKALTLDDIVGQRVGFCGVDNQTIVLLVDGKLRAFDVVEDEEDGYRSSLEEVREVPIGDTIHFREPVADVIVSEIAAARCDGYQLADDSGHVWLQVGTDYSCDYYPCFVFDYTPPERPVVAEALPRWVPVGERLPEMGKPVLVAVGAHADLDEIEIAELRRDRHAR